LLIFLYIGLNFKSIKLALSCRFIKNVVRYAIGDQKWKVYLWM